MKSKIWLFFFAAFVLVFLFAACADQKVLLTPVITQTPLPSNTPHPTDIVSPTQITAHTAIPLLDRCEKNPVPAELLASLPAVQNNKLIVFNSEPHSDIYWNYADIYSIEFDGSNLKKLTTYAGDDWGPRWSADGKKILFYSDRNHPVCTDRWTDSNCKLESFMMNPDGSGSRKVTPDLPDYPDRSPNGKYIVDERSFYDELRLEHGLGDYLSDIIIVNISGSYLRNITAQFQPGIFEAVEWSPDGKHLAFVGGTDPSNYTDTTTGKRYRKYSVYIANADGTGLRKLDGGPYQNKGGTLNVKAWSPDGKRLAYFESKGIAIINADGSGFSEYTLDKSINEPQRLYWLDDGQQLVFTDVDDNFYKINTDFSGLEKLSFATEIDKLIYRFQILKTRTIWDQNEQKVLSPDGRWIAYFTCSQIRVISTETRESYFILDAKQIEQLSQNSDPPIYAHDFGNDLIWSPDSRQLIFTQDVNYGEVIHTFKGLFAINIDGTGLRQISENALWPALQP
jgi:Tol biopolymer transport system component